MKFGKIKDVHTNELSWKQLGLYGDGEIKLINPMGGWMPLGNDEILEIVDAEWFDELDWTGTWLDDPTQSAGWLSRSGRFYGCGYSNHLMCASYMIKKDSIDLENQGWVKVNKGPNERCGDWFDPYYFPAARKGYRMTAEQAKWLVDHGHEIRPGDYD